MLWEPLTNLQMVKLLDKRKLCINCYHKIFGDLLGMSSNVDLILVLYKLIMS